MMRETASVLLACDVRYGDDPLGKAWVDSFVETMTSRGWTVHVLAREVADIADYDGIRRSGGEILIQDTVPPEHQDAHGHAPRYRARAIVRYAADLGSDLVVVQGRTLSRFVAGSGLVDKRLWTIPLERPYTGGRFDRADFSDLATIAGASARILVADEAQRSTMDSEFHEASSKVRILPLFGHPGYSSASTVSSPDSAGSRTAPSQPGATELSDAEELHIHEGLFTDKETGAFERLGTRLRALRQIPRIHIHRNTCEVDPSTDSDSDAEKNRNVSSFLRSLPGVVTDQTVERTGSLVLPRDPIARHYGLLLAGLEGRPTVDLEHSRQAPSARGLPSDSLTPSLNTLDEATVEPVASRKRQPLKMVIAGSDFKFAGDLVETFLSDSSFDVRFDLFDHHAHPQPKKSQPYIEWAEVILAEFAVHNAIWYSKNLASHQTLIVHLHGFELTSEWISELDIDKVSVVVVPSEFYRRRAHELRGWPLDKLVVIPNSVNPFDLVRPKQDDARFHLGLVGMVPILKRPDRALDLLERLAAIDSRYTLHIRGHSPWNYTWEWKKAAHQDAYREFYARLGQRPELHGAIAFEPFAPDMGNWLRKIGWILSPSSRETFHLAAVEGAVSGAVPLAWDRDGAQEIIGDEWTFSSTEEIYEYVRSHNESAQAHSATAHRARQRAAQYRSDRVGHLWRTTVLDICGGVSAIASSDGPRGVADAVFREVDELVRAGEYDEAKGALDRNIQVTKNDCSKLKDLEMFVRGLLALDARRTDLIPAFRDSAAAIRSLTSNSTDTYVRICALANSDRNPRLLADPNIVVGNIGVVPFGYTGEEKDDTRTDAAFRTAAGAARSTTAFSGAVVTDALEEYLDMRVAVGRGLRFDRWVEVVASELRDGLKQFGEGKLLIEAPWHLAIPAAVAAARAGKPYVWAPPVDSTNDAVQTIRTNPYTGDIKAQFVGLLISRADAVVVPESVRSAEEPSTSSLQIRNRVEAAAGRRPDGRNTGGLRFDSHTAAQVTELSASLDGHQLLGALNAPKTARTGENHALRLGVLSDARFIRRISAASDVIEVVPLRSITDLEPSLDALIVDESAMDSPQSIPASGSVEQGIRGLFDAARSSGVLGIFNGESHVGGNRSASTVAEKADAVTGTRAILTLGLLGRNPNSITRVGSASLDCSNASDLHTALAAVGVGTDRVAPEPAAVLPRRRPTESAQVASQIRPSLLRLGASDGVSLVVATRLGAQRLPTMLASIAAQSMHPSRMELVIVHNGPRDGTDTVVKAFADANPRMLVRFTRSEVEGASQARNLGLSLITRDYVTFVDDDDELEHNYILNMWLSAADDVVVASPLRDVTGEGESLTDIPNNRRLAGLTGRRTDLNRASGLLGMNACKLIPSRIAGSIQYPTELQSGEDVAYMSQLLLHHLDLVPADTAPEAAYVRHMRPDSVSRRELTREFAVEQRLGVIAHLERVRTNGPKKVVGCIRALQLDQLSFVARYLTENPDEGETVIAQVLEAGVPSSQLAGRYKSLHALALRSESSPG